MQCCAAVGTLGATCRKQQRRGGEGIGVWIVLLSVINPLSARTMSQQCCRRLHCSSKRERNKRMIDNFVCLWFEYRGARSHARLMKIWALKTSFSAAGSVNPLRHGTCNG